MFAHGFFQIKPHLLRGYAARCAEGLRPSGRRSFPSGATPLAAAPPDLQFFTRRWIPLARCKPYPERFGRWLDEADKPFSIFGQRVAILFSQLVEWLDHKRRGGFGLFDLPRAAHEAVHQNGRRDKPTYGADANWACKPASRSIAAGAESV